ncbi:putative AAA+ superfamily ATPase [Parabacteroides sp. PFB2-12]|uniref:ATP-binding protein n=1 Tax=unclassified Parabacteroides TaxID=2649774 RepID=UPI0024761BCD|nr:MULTISPECIES: AAA family ATPase [unclassified Parabacteroides]MDH6341515.1 putative AAA+ superfamily ATPase [Parabacteroides sp. PM6-13]MDH6389309.1 putative AAA+ superfamily ATPase [Parabacteroides sp. PFB2-12]
MESFYKTHKYLVEHLYSPVRRGLMDEIDWNDRLIGIKGSRGVGKTTFLLSIAREHFGADNKECLYINLNHFYFTERTLIDFASEYRAKGGKVLLLDQVFKYPDWSKELRYCYDHFTDLKIVFTGSTVMRLKEENPDLSGKVVSYHLRGFSFREFLNLMSGNSFPMYTLEEIIANHEEIAKRICSVVKPMAYFQDYLHHGFYPFFLEKRNFSENLLKTMNMILEVDVLYIKQIEQTYLPKLRKLLYLLAINAPCTPNVSQLSKEIETSRATVMNYIKYLTDARLMNMLYPVGESFPKKPSKVYMYSSNLIYPIRPEEVNLQAVRETFFFNQLMKDSLLNEAPRNAHFLVNETYHFRIEENVKIKNNPDFYYAVDKTEIGEGNMIPLWLFGFLY